MILAHLGHRTVHSYGLKPRASQEASAFSLASTSHLDPRPCRAQVSKSKRQVVPTCRLEEGVWAIDKFTRSSMSPQARRSWESQIQQTSHGRLTHQRGTRDKDRAEILSRVFGRGT